jgi:UDP-N-acetyl-D-glucosamine dehydrogenase
VPTVRVRRNVTVGTLEAETDFARLSECDAIIICVPTPLEKNNDPDLSYVESAVKSIAERLRPGQLIVLESTTYPGTTDELLLPMLSREGMQLDTDFLLAFSPERVDPGNKTHKITEIPKVIGGCSPLSTEAAAILYGSIMQQIHTVSSARAAETSKLLENTFRSVNIALANEIALLCDHLGIDTREVIAAAATKPFGFMPFTPGPGVGGHCIPLDPLYLSWRAKQQGFNSRLITLADEINSSMPEHVVDRIADALNDRGKTVKDAKILLLGVAFKENIDDARRTPATPIIDRLRAKKALVSYHDPFVPRFEVDLSDWPEWRKRREPLVRDRRRRLSGALPSATAGRRRSDALTSLPLTDELLSSADCVVIVTKHDAIDYDRVARLAPLIMDTRYALTPRQRELASGKVLTL